jgi:hypothetical protein
VLLEEEELELPAGTPVVRIPVVAGGATPVVRRTPVVLEEDEEEELELARTPVVRIPVVAGGATPVVRRTPVVLVEEDEEEELELPA